MDFSVKLVTTKKESIIIQPINELDELYITLSNLCKRTQEMKSEDKISFACLSDRITCLEKNVSEMNEDIKKLKEDNKELKEDNKKLKEDNKELGNKLTKFMANSDWRTLCSPVVVEMAKHIRSKLLKECMRLWPKDNMPPKKKLNDNYSNSQEYSG